jgi:hypothetical protein
VRRVVDCPCHRAQNRPIDVGCGRSDFRVTAQLVCELERTLPQAHAPDPFLDLPGKPGGQPRPEGGRCPSEQEASGLLDRYLERSIGGPEREGALHVRCTDRPLFGGREGPSGANQSRRRDDQSSCDKPTSAEGEGFEPSVDRKAHNGFRDRPVQPLRHPSEES